MIFLIRICRTESELTSERWTEELALEDGAILKLEDDVTAKGGYLLFALKPWCRSRVSIAIGLSVLSAACRHS